MIKALPFLRLEDGNKGLGAKLRACLVRKFFQDSPSHRILRHIHEALNIGENKN